jgi:PAS domain S-box-containing protein
MPIANSLINSVADEPLAQFVLHDAEQEAALHELTQLVAQLTRAPIAFISFIDREHQHIVSSVGFTAREIPRSHSLCETALQHPDVFVVLDASRDERFLAHPFVTGEPHARFYAGTAIRDANDTPIGLICAIDTVARDAFPPELAQLLRVISRQVMTQLGLRMHTKKLAEREQLLSAIFDAETECVKLIRPDGTLHFMSRSGLELIEASSLQAVQDMPVFDLVVPEARERIREVHLAALAGSIGTAEYQIVSLKGTRHWMEMRIAPIRNHAGVITGTLGVSRDMTVQIEAQASLRASEAQLAAAQARAHLGSWEVDFATGNTVWSAEMWRLHYLPQRGQAPDIDEYVQCVHPDDRAAFAALLRQSPDATEPAHFEYRTAPALGPMRYLAATVTVLRDDARRSVGQAGTALDITERKRADRRLRRLTESNAQGVLYWTVDGAVTYANDAFLGLVGYTREEMERGELRWTDITPAEHVANDQHALRELAATGLCTPYEKEYLRKDGGRVPVLLGAACFEDQPTEGVSFVLDLTEHKKLERHYLRAQRLESIGTLAGGIAHDLNNVLAPIMLAMELLRPELTSADSLSLLDHISESAERGANMVRQLLTFARGLEGKKLDVDMWTLVKSVQRIVDDTFLKSISMHTHVAPGLWTIHGDATQLHQLLLNLCVNARDAMPHGGTLRIRADNFVVDDAVLATHRELRHGSYVRVTVEDNGSGIPATIIDHVFDPFFSTKTVEKGTGLGLATSLAIAKSHGGYIYIDSGVGRGTTLAVYIPAKDAPITPTRLRPEAQFPQGRGELVLVVDDEDAIRHVTKSTLELFGYRALTAKNGNEAIQLFEQHQTEIALLLTDMMMSGLDGIETIRAIHRINPSLPVIATSGLDTPDRNGGIEALRVQHFLAKPFSVEQLLNALQSVFTRT